VEVRCHDEDDLGGDVGGGKRLESGGGDDAECAAAAAPEGPEEIGVGAFVCCDDVAGRRDGLYFEDLVCG